MPTDTSFFAAVVGAGAILSGFCGTFLAFRIQREANYHRQPVLSYENADAKDIHIGLTHFTYAFLLLLLATTCSLAFGFLLPLLALAQVAFALHTIGLVVGGLVAAVVLLAGYFIAELVHYDILTSHLLHDLEEKRSERGIVIAAGFLAALLMLVSCLIL
jgi:hypothetical protein